MKNRKFFSGFALLLLITFFNANTLAQDTEKLSDKRVDKVIVKLQQKVLLSDQQTSRVKTIINSYLQSDQSSKDLEDAQNKIESLLDDKQKEKYNIIKNDWWKGVGKVSKSEK